MRRKQPRTLGSKYPGKSDSWWEYFDLLLDSLNAEKLSEEEKAALATEMTHKLKGRQRL
jgi:hypothetical protein